MKILNYKIILLSLLLLVSFGCSEDFLEVESRTSLTESNFYRTEEDALSAVAAIYDALSVQNWQYVPIMSDIFSDDAFAGGASAGDMAQRQVFETSLLDAENPAAAALWDRCYRGIYRANTFLEKSSQINWTSEAKKARMEGEAKFLRAYFYWDLARHFGWVPIITEVKTIEFYRQAEQADPFKVYSQVATDLLDAIEALPATVPESETGRATKYAAQALMGRIYLYYQGFVKEVLNINQDWTDGETVIDEQYVENALNEIITSEQYRLLDDYADVFDWHNENSEESVFEWQYSDKSGVTDWDGWGINGNFSVIFYGVRNPAGDNTIDPGWSFATITWSLVDAYEEGDSRLQTVVYNADDSLSDYLHAFQNTGYFNWKYLPRKEFRAIRGARPHNYPINYKDIRYADVLLMAAELHLDDNTEKAQNYYDMVRKRAFGSDHEAPVVSKENIIKERRLEFAGEGKRKWDLLRMGLDYAKEHIDASFDVPAGVPNAADFQGRFFDKSNWGMFPIPATEIRNTNEGVLQQHVPAF